MTEEQAKRAGGVTEKKMGPAAPVKPAREVVHALNNVLAVIQLNASMALENLAAGQPMEEEIREILDGVLRGRDLIKELSLPPQPEIGPGPGHGGSAPVAAVPAVSGATPSPESGEGGTILFVDDEIELARLGQRLLIKKGYQVTLFTDSREALAAFTADPQGFALVVTDQNMPGINGIELAGRILRIRPEVPIILCTGYSTGFSRWNFRDHGFCEMLVKPYQPAELLSVVRAVLAHQGE